MTMSYNILFWHILGYFQFHPATWKHWFHLYILIMPHRDCWCNSAQILVISKLPEESTWRTSSYRCFRDVRSVFCFTSLDSLQEQDTIQKLGAKCVDVFPMINDIYIYVCDIRVGVFVFGCLCGTSCCILYHIFRCLFECSSYKPRF